MKHPLTVLAAVAVATSGALLLGCSKAPPVGKEGKGRNAAITAPLMVVGRANAPLETTAIGQLQASHSVVVQPQLAAMLTAAYFVEGSAVSAGQKLFSLDDAPYRVALTQAQAQLASQQANLQAAQAQAARLAPLQAQGYVTPQELEAAQAAQAQAQAAVKLAEAGIAAAQINLGRTVIHAPISGIAGALLVKPGNVVAIGTPLVTLNQLSPIEAVFALPEADLAAVRSAYALRPIAVQARSQQGGAVLASGLLSFIDNGLEAGTLKLKARFANPQQALWPGSFVSLSLHLGDEANRVLVPEQAVAPGVEGSHVYVVGADHKAVLQPVTVLRQVGGQLVIGQGLQGGETIVAAIPRELKPGSVVAEPNASPAPAKHKRPKT